MNIKSRIVTNIKMFLILFIILAPVSYADDWKEVINLEGYWKFSIGDNLEWSKFDFNDEDWDEVRIPSPWEDQGYNNYNGYAWYRYKFIAPEEISNKSMYISLGFIDDVDETYLNGTLIGSSGTFPPKYNTAYNAQRKYPVIPNYFYPGKENVIAVRVYDSRLIGGIVGGDISLMVLQSLDLELNLEGYWKFNIGDNNIWKNSDFDDSNWTDIQVPAHWEVQGFPDYDGFGWYRKKFILDDKFEGENLILLLGKIDDIDQCYLNGEMIGITGDFELSPKTNKFGGEYNELRGYNIPKKLLKFNEENSISIRVYDGFIGGGIYQGPVGIITQEEYKNYWKEKKRKKSFWDYLFDDL